MKSATILALLVWGLIIIPVIAVPLVSPGYLFAANNPPMACPTATPPRGDKSLRVQFAANAEDPDGDRLMYDWNFGDPCNPDNISRLENPVHLYEQIGHYYVALTVSDGWDSANFSLTIRVGRQGIHFLLGDLDLNRVVNIMDIRAFVHAYLTQNGEPNWPSNADLDSDSTVEMHDLALLAWDWKNELPDHYAVIVGISDYNLIDDMDFGVEDATDWYNYFTYLGYEHIFVLGDTHPGNYPQYDYFANELNIKVVLQNVVNSAEPNGIISFVFSGRGGGDGLGSAYLAAWDSGVGLDGEDGDLYDYELADILSKATANVFVFLDSSLSGGMLDDLSTMSNASNVYATSTCGFSGNRIDLPVYRNGAWHYWFLDAGLKAFFGSSRYTDMEDCFMWADTQYNPGGDDEPLVFDGHFGEDFILW
jgi:hypothetical protein